MSGKPSSRRVSPVGAQSTMTASKSPLSWWRLICSRLKSSSMPGGTVSSSARICSMPRSASSFVSQSCDRRPVRLHLALGPHLLAPEPVAGRRRLGPEVDLERVGEAVGGIGRQHDRPQAGGAHSGARSRRRRWSCRPRPCRCRGSSAAAARPPSLRRARVSRQVSPPPIAASATPRPCLDRARDRSRRGLIACGDDGGSGSDERPAGGPRPDLRQRRPAEIESADIDLSFEINVEGESSGTFKRRPSPGRSTPRATGSRSST